MVAAGVEVRPVGTPAVPDEPGPGTRVDVLAEAVVEHLALDGDLRERVRLR